jgi:CBS domain-containing protein
VKGFSEYAVADIMTVEPLVIAQDETLHSALEIFADNRVSAIPVVDDHNKVVGILSITDLVNLLREVQTDLSALWSANQNDRDYLLGALKEESGQMLISEIMSTPVETVKATHNVIVAAQIMAREQFRHLPVVDSHHHPVGMLSSTDFVRAIADIGALMAG